MENTGSALWSPDFELKAKLPKGTLIYTAELNMALKFVKNTNYDYNIFADSLSTANGLRRPHLSNHHLIRKITVTIKKIKKQLKIHWIPSHFGTPGNDRADDGTKRAAEMNYITKLPLAQGYYKNLP